MMTCFLLLLVPANLAQLPTIRVTADRTELRLSDTLTLTLTVEGVAPLRVRPPTAWLPAEASQTWMLRLSPEATSEAVAPDRQRWTQMLIVEPMAASDVVPLTLNSVVMLSGPAATEVSLAVPPLSVRVIGLPPGSVPRIGGPILELPAAPPRRVPIPVMLGMAGMILGGCVLLIQLIRSRGKAIESPLAASPTLDELTEERHTSAEFAAALKADVTERLGRIPGSVSVGDLMGTIPSDIVDALLRCDSVIYGQAELDPTQRRDLLETARNRFASPPLDQPTDDGRTTPQVPPKPET